MIACAREFGYWKLGDMRGKKGKKGKEMISTGSFPS